MLRDSTEVDELLYPIIVWADRFVSDSGGPGRFRGAPASYVEYGPADTEIDAMWSTDGYVHPAIGARGGHPGTPARQYLRASRWLGRRAAGLGRVGRWAPATPSTRSRPAGGGYGPPWERDVELVLDDIRSGLVSREQAADVYAVVVDEAGLLDATTTDARREGAREAREQPRSPDFAEQAQLIADRLADYVRPLQDR